MQIAFGLYPGFTALDFVGPYNVLSNVPGVDTMLCADAPGVVSDDNGLLHLQIAHGFADVPRPNILLVPGGPGTREVAAAKGPIVEWIRSAHEHTTWTTSVCTGALLLGAAGLLEGKRATTHWLSYDELAGYGATPTEERVVFDGKVVTAAGVSAGIDMALTLVDRQWGPELSQGLQLAIEYDPQPPHDAGAPSKAPTAIRELVTSVMRAGRDPSPAASTPI